MKRIPIFLLTIMLGFSLGPIKPVSAVISEKGTTWWTVDELLDFYPEVEAEKEAECGDNEECKMDFLFGLYERGPKYSALENLIQGQFWITSVNPGTETIKVLFFDEDMMLKHMGIDEILHLEHLYIGWVENWNGQIYNYDYERFSNGSITGNHPMYVGSSSVDGPDWLPVWTEYELSVSNSELKDNTHGKIDYAIFAEDNMYNAQGHFDILSCLNSPDYQVGMECKMYVSGDQWVSYFPPRESVIEQNEPQELNDELIGPLEEQGEPQGTESETESTNLLEEQNIQIAEQTTEINVSEPAFLSQNQDKVALKTPETGQNTIEHENNTEMPWWIALLNIFGILLIVWWFIPSKSLRIKKRIQKTSKKVLTKNADCDKMVSV